MLVKPKKFLGQHFLKDLKIAQSIADTVDCVPDLPILEIGPGMGVLTQFLLTKNRPLSVVEIDRESVDYLMKNFSGLSNNIIEDDFLKMDLRQTFKGCPFVLMGNYPYNISSQIFFRLLEYSDIIPLCTGMIQKEVAERIAAPEGNRDRGILSVLLQCKYDVKYLFTVEPNVFNPPPKVKSAVISMVRKENIAIDCDERLFRSVVKTSFNQRRKQLRNSIRPLLAKMEGQPRQKERIIDYTDLLTKPIFNLRPEQLSVSDFVHLTNLIADEFRNSSTCFMKD